MQAQEMQAIHVASISRKANANGGEGQWLKDQAKGENEKQYGSEFQRENNIFQLQEGK